MKQLPLARSFFAVLLLSASFLFPGCATTVKEKPSPSDPRTLAVLKQIEEQNAGIKTFNGQGAINITEPSKISSYRLAWAGAFPDRIRLIILFSGKPVETVVSDGEHLYLKSHTGAHSTITRNKKNPSLEPYISLPLTTNQITCYLSGRIPIPEYQKVHLDKRDDNKGSVLTFYKNEKTVIQRIFLDQNNQILSYEITLNEKTSYQVNLEKSGNGDGFLFPTTITVVQGDRLYLIRVERTTPNPELAPETFVINP